jgi:hypothetical protein
MTEFDATKEEVQLLLDKLTELKQDIEVTFDVEYDPKTEEEIDALLQRLISAKGILFRLYSKAL